MLPFGSQFIGGQPPTPNLLFITSATTTPAAAASIIGSNVLSVPSLTFPQLPNVPQPPTQPMLIAPNIFKELKSEASFSGVSNGNSLWSQHAADDGRVYYYNKATKVSSWTKPDELKTQEEKELSVWKEYKTPEGKPYYYNTQTKVTTWSKPEALNKDMRQKKDEGEAVHESKPELVHISSNSEIEKAMEATLKTLVVKKNEEPNEPKESAPQKEMEEDSEYNLKKKQVEIFRELLQDKCNEKRINTNMNWEQASKYIQNDPRYKMLGKVSEKKQVFNAWKIQRYKEERDERRFTIKMAKESLEKWLMSHPKMKPTLRYHKAEGIFAMESQWKAVTEPERREIFEDVKIALAKRESEQKKSSKERNIKALSDILDGIDKIDYRTTWAEAQRILIENPSFANDTTLQGMEREDALIVFQKHIKVSEEQYVREKQLEAKRIKRQERKTREAFLQLLHELHDRALITPTSSWAQIYPMVSTDQRFENMLLTNGSTALDLFKFYVEELRTKYHEDKKAIKEILESKGVSFDESTTFEAFRQWVKEGSSTTNQLDPVNVKLCFNDLVDKILLKKKEAERDELKKQKRAELAFWDVLRSLSPAVGPNSAWDQIKEQLKESGQLETTADDEQLKLQFFNSYVKSLQDFCGHYHSSTSGNSKKKKKDKRKKYDQEIPSDLEEMSAKIKRRRKKEEKSEEEEEEAEKKRRKKKRSKKRSRDESDEEHNE